MNINHKITIYFICGLILITVFSCFSMSCLSYRPKEAFSPYLKYVTKTQLRLPFVGEWYVIQGGRTVAQNYHAAYSEVRFAYDFVIVKKYSTHMSDGAKNSDYYCFGAVLVAPASGTVMIVDDGHPDCAPGKIDKVNPKGNYIIIDHQNGEYSFMAHFKQNSITVKVGDQIVAGQILGYCGNSGNTSESHLHYQLQNADGECLPAQFHNYIVDGIVVDSDEPVRGQQIREKTY
jgi:hypothetical protein